MPGQGCDHESAAAQAPAQQDMTETFLTSLEKESLEQECSLIESSSSSQTGSLMTAASDKAAVEFLWSPSGSSCI